MKHGVISKDKAAMLILMIVFVSMIIFIVACATMLGKNKVALDQHFK